MGDCYEGVTLTRSDVRRDICDQELETLGELAGRGTGWLYNACTAPRAPFESVDAWLKARVDELLTVANQNPEEPNL